MTVTLTLELARQMVAAALGAAHEQGALVTAAVVDAGGHLVALERLDGAEIAGPTLATDKAFSAVSHRISTLELGRLAVPGAPLFGVQMANGGRWTIIGGGVPLWSGGRVVAGVGVSGGTVEQDVAAAQVGALVWAAAGGDLDDEPQP